jgi:anaerobic magnesium-protoporphyrin IX monomethyl ester cyclase
MALDLVLINPPLTMEERYGKFAALGSSTPNLGLCYLASSARSKGFSVKIIDSPVQDLDVNQTVSLVKELNPKFIGITAATVSIIRASRLAAAIKEIGIKTPLIIGGAHVSALPSETMKEFPAFDIGVMNEGELTILDLLNTVGNPRELEKIAGLIFREGEDIFLTPPKKPIENIDLLPYPAFDLLPDMVKYYRPASHSYLRLPSAALVTSRGCNGTCTFCARPFIGERYRGHSAEYTLEMIDILVKQYGVRDILFYDDNFLLDKKRVTAICEGLLKKSYNISWSCLARNETISPDFCKLIKRAGCWQIAFGIESGDQTILNNLKKRTTVEKNLKAIELTNKAGIHSRGYFMIGCPGETVESMNKTMEFTVSSGLKDFHSTFCTPMPGSELFETAESYGTFDRDWNKLGFWEPAFIPKGLTSEQIISTHKNMFRAFYLRPKIILRYAVFGMLHPDRIVSYLKAGLAILSYIFKTKAEDPKKS